MRVKFTEEDLILLADRGMSYTQMAEYLNGSLSSILKHSKTMLSPEYQDKIKKNGKMRMIQNGHSTSKNVPIFMYGTVKLFNNKGEVK